MHNERAVSEVLGFILIASVILSSLSIVYVFGLSGLEDVRDEERIDNGERAFTILADNMADINRRGAPSRATEIKLAGAELAYGESTSLTVEVTNVGSPVPQYSVSTQPIVYSADSGSQLVYENGAIIRQEDDGGAVLKRAPSGAFHDGIVQTAVIPYVETRDSGSASLGGSTTALIRSELIVREVLGSHLNDSESPTTDPDGDGTPEFAVTYRVETTDTRASVWRDHLNDRIPSSFEATSPACQLSASDTVECQIAVERLYVSASRVDVTLSG